jgi:hypothetical protein
MGQIHSLVVLLYFKAVVVSYFISWLPDALPVPRRAAAGCQICCRVKSCSAGCISLLLMVCVPDSLRRRWFFKRNYKAKTTSRVSYKLLLPFVRLHTAVFIPLDPLVR